jgi:hypothetical protein
VRGLEDLGVLGHVLIHLLGGSFTRREVQKRPQIRRGLVKRLLDAQPLQPVHRHVRKLSLREAQPGIQWDMLDLLPFPRSVHPPLDHKLTEDREVPAFPGVLEAAEDRAFDVDARPRISVALRGDESAHQGQAQLQEPREQLPLHPVNPLPGICRLLHVPADCFELGLRVEKSSLL